MIKNTGSQKIGGQLITAADGSDFTGAVTVYITGDAGSQALGSVGSGVCTHEGKGYHTYAPAQAETNYDLIAFTFIGSGAISSTIQVFTVLAQLTGLSAADVNTQMLDVLNVDTFAEPGQEAPTSTTTLIDKIGYIYKFLRNKVTTTTTQISVFNDAGAVVDHKSTISDTAGTATRGEFDTGP